MRVKLDSTVAVPEAVVRFPIPAGASLRSVTVNGKAVSGWKGNTVELNEVNGSQDIQVRF